MERKPDVAAIAGASGQTFVTFLKYRTYGRFSAWGLVNKEDTKCPHQDIS